MDADFVYCFLWLNMIKLLIRLNQSSSEIKRKEIRGNSLRGESSFFNGRLIMEDIDAKLDHVASILAEIFLSQLGFSFFPSVKPSVIRPRNGGLFSVIADFPDPDINFYHYESLIFMQGANIYGAN